MKKQWKARHITPLLTILWCIGWMAWEASRNTLSGWLWFGIFAILIVLNVWIYRNSRRVDEQIAKEDAAWNEMLRRLGIEDR